LQPYYIGNTCELQYNPPGIDGLQADASLLSGRTARKAFLTVCAKQMPVKIRELLRQNAFFAFCVHREAALP